MQNDSLGRVICSQEITNGALHQGTETLYDDANRAVAYKIDGDAQQVFSELCAVISEYGTYTR